ncbi:hypothetical protein BCR32DRAFT_268860 [Anaeromyces robustus]|uniref:Uncharacterized protein n=1 Tax=Anaeromyces robustus TaxID=1754192 RepID=A0A1Y1X3V6_9FUNG|nr:hypothetical protein BCR32DRAFT_268860 [Anaeromyces robustus]|eukprot:ORX80491.1 hypothetical protein BCR32DRAFT_268860 [Anaeromyces robustus]
MQTYNNSHLNSLCNILFNKENNSTDDKSNDITVDISNNHTENFQEFNNGFSSEVLNKVQFNYSKLQEKYNFKNVLNVWKSIFSLKNINENETFIQYIEFSYLKKNDCFKNNYLKTLIIPENFKIKYSMLKDEDINDEKIRNFKNQYMTIWIDFLKILGIHLSSQSNLLNSSNENIIFQEKSELNNKSIPLKLNLLNSNTEEMTKYMATIENFLEQQWSIFGQEFIKKLQAILFIFKTSTFKQKTTNLNNNNLSSSIQIALTLLTSLFEKSLGDILYTIILNKAKIPFLFKDLIIQPELIQLWQKKTNYSNNSIYDKKENINNDFDLDIITLVLVLLFGGPKYINIRNLLWHGFVILPSFSFVSSSKTENENTYDIFPIHHYFQIIWSIFNIVFNRIKESLIYQHHLKNKNDDLSIDLSIRPCSNTLANDQFIFNFDCNLFIKNEILIHNLIEHSFFPINESKILWHEAFHRYFEALKMNELIQKNEDTSNDNNSLKKTTLYKSYNYLIFLNSILPLFEHSLRCLYVVANQLKEIRYLTANTYEYYIIIDTIFNENLLIDETVESENFIKSEEEMESANVKNIMGLQNTNLKPNNITKIFKPQFIMAIYDLFILQNGIRIRDKISHGDFQIDQFNNNYSEACHLLVILILETLYRFQMNPNVKKNNDDSSCLKTEIHNYIEYYEIQFHPKSFILKNTQKLIIEMYAIFQSYKQIFIHNDQIFSEMIESFSNINDEEEINLINPLIITLLMNEYENDNQKNVIFKTFQPTFFYKCLTNEQLMNNIFPKIKKIISSRLYGSAQQIRFYNACSRILWICTDKILNSLINYTTNLINNNSYSTFNIVNIIENYKKEIHSVGIKSNNSDSSNLKNKDIINNNNDDNDDNDDDDNDNDESSYKIPDILSISTRKRKKLKELPKYLKEILECCMLCGLIIGWFIIHENDYFFFENNENDKVNQSVNENIKRKQQEILQKLFKLIYKLEVFCERISAYIDKGTLNSIKKEYQLMEQYLKTFILYINKLVN